MAEYTANDIQVVQNDQAVMFDEQVVRNGSAIYHREGSGIFTLRAMTCQPFARFRVTFGANVAIPTGGTVGPITLALALSGEANTSTQMIVTPAAVDEYFNINRTATINVPGGCCSQLSVENISGVDVNVQNASIVIERIA